MPDRFISALKYAEFITLNVASFGWVLLNETTKTLAATPEWVTILVGLSIVFFNIARGIQALRNKKKDS